MAPASRHPRIRARRCAVTIDAACESCGIRRTYQGKAVEVALYTHGHQRLRFFCLTCRAYNEIELDDVLAERLCDMGLPSTVVVVPLEVLEWPSPRRPPICLIDVEVFSRNSVGYMQRRVAAEIGGP